MAILMQMVRDNGLHLHPTCTSRSSASRSVVRRFAQLTCARAGVAGIYFSCAGNLIFWLSCCEHLHNNQRMHVFDARLERSVSGVSPPSSFGRLGIDKFRNTLVFLVGCTW
jgi:hypothetical protein